MILSPSWQLKLSVGFLVFACDPGDFVETPIALRVQPGSVVSGHRLEPAVLEKWLLFW